LASVKGHKPYKTALDYVKAEIEHKIAQYDENSLIDISKLDASQYRYLVQVLTSGFLEFGDYEWIEPKFVQEIIDVVREKRS